MRDPERMLRLRQARWPQTIEDRFWSKVQKLPGDGCWIWTRSKVTGYGHFHIQIAPYKHRKIYAHRWAWESVHGPLPSGLQIDHLCRNRACVRPDHMELVTNRENCLRGLNSNVITHHTKVCKRGHEFADNDYKGRCRICMLERSKRRYYEHIEEERERSRRRWAEELERRKALCTS